MAPHQETELAVIRHANIVKRSARAAAPSVNGVSFDGRAEKATLAGTA